MKFDSIFDSLGPVGGILTGDKVKPVLLNSKLPVDILGRVCNPQKSFSHEIHRMMTKYSFRAEV